MNDLSSGHGLQSVQTLQELLRAFFVKRAWLVALVGLLAGPQCANASPGTITMPVLAEDATKVVYGPCGDWPGLENGCLWFSMQSRDATRVWRDVNPYQKEKGSKGYHLGSDLNLGSGSFDAEMPVRSISQGQVINVVENAKGWGNALFVRHTTPLGPVVAVYAHIEWLEGVPPTLGTNYETGQTLAKIGNGFMNLLLQMITVFSAMAMEVCCTLINRVYLLGLVELKKGEQLYSFFQH